MKKLKKKIREMENRVELIQSNLELIEMNLMQLMNAENASMKEPEWFITTSGGSEIKADEYIAADLVSSLGMASLSTADKSTVSINNLHDLISERTDDKQETTILLVGRGDKMNTFLKEHYENYKRKYLYCELLPEEFVYADKFYCVDMIVAFNEIQCLNPDILKKLSLTLIDNADVYFVI